MQRDHRAGETREPGREREGPHQHRSAVHAHELGRSGIVGARTPGAAEAAQLHEAQDADCRQRAQDRGAERHGRHGDHEVAGARHCLRRIEHRRHPHGLRALRQTQVLLQHHGKGDGSDQHPLPPVRDEGGEDEAGLREPIGGGRRHPHQQCEPDRRRHAPAHAGEHHGQHRCVAAHTCELAERQIDTPRQPVDEGVGSRQHGVDGGARQRQQQMLQADSERKWNSRRVRRSGNRLGIRRRALRLEPEPAQQLQTQRAHGAGIRGHADERTVLRKAALDEAGARRARGGPHSVVDAHAVPGGKTHRARDLEPCVVRVDGRDDAAAGARLVGIEAGRAASKKDGERDSGAGRRRRSPIAPILVCRFTPAHCGSALCAPYAPVASRHASSRRMPSRMSTCGFQPSTRSASA